MNQFKIIGRDYTDTEQQRYIAARKWAFDKFIELPEDVIDESTTSSELDQNVIIRLIEVKNTSEAMKPNDLFFIMTSVRVLIINDLNNFSIIYHLHVMELSVLFPLLHHLHLTFKRGEQLGIECHDDDLRKKIYQQLYTNYSSHNPGFRGELACKWLDQYKASQENDLEDKYPVILESVDPLEQSAHAFKSWAYFHGTNVVKLLSGIKNAIKGPLGMMPSHENWFYTKDLCSLNEELVMAGLLCIAFTMGSIHGVEVTDIKGDTELYNTVETLFTYHKGLRALVLDACGGGFGLIQLMICKFLEDRNFPLKEFRLKNMCIGDKGVKYWTDGNNKMKRHPTHIALTKAGATSETLTNFIKSLPGAGGGSAGGGTGGLEELDISENPLDSKGTLMLSNRLVNDFHNLKMLNVCKCNVDSHPLLTAIKQATEKGSLSLESLILTDNYLPDNSVKILSEIAEKSVKLRELGIGNIRAKDLLIIRCIKGLFYRKSEQILFSIDLSRNHLSAKCVSLLIDTVSGNKQISTLNIKYCGLSKQQFNLLTNELQKNHHNLRHFEYLEIYADAECKEMEAKQSRFDSHHAQFATAKEWLRDDIKHDMDDTSEHESDSSVLCSYYNSKSGCKFGSNCKNIHTDEVCTYWSKGRCTRSRCAYRHCSD